VAAGEGLIMLYNAVHPDDRILEDIRPAVAAALNRLGRITGHHVYAYYWLPRRFASADVRSIERKGGDTADGWTDAAVPAMIHLVVRDGLTPDQYAANARHEWAHSFELTRCRPGLGKAVSGRLPLPNGDSVAAMDEITLPGGARCTRFARMFGDGRAFMFDTLYLEALRDWGRGHGATFAPPAIPPTLAVRGRGPVPSFRELCRRHGIPFSDGA
jgi:hypothetical protein